MLTTLLALSVMALAIVIELAFNEVHMYVASLTEAAYDFEHRMRLIRRLDVSLIEFV